MLCDCRFAILSLRTDLTECHNRHCTTASSVLVIQKSQECLRSIVWFWILPCFPTHKSVRTSTATHMYICNSDIVWILYSNESLHLSKVKFNRFNTSDIRSVASQKENLFRGVMFFVFLNSWVMLKQHDKNKTVNNTNFLFIFPIQFKWG